MMTVYISSLGRSGGLDEVFELSLGFILGVETKGLKAKNWKGKGKWLFHQLILQSERKGRFKKIENN